MSLYKSSLYKLISLKGLLTVVIYCYCFSSQSQSLPIYTLQKTDSFKIKKFSPTDAIRS